MEPTGHWQVLVTTRDREKRGRAPGNAWIANNWNGIDALASPDPIRRTWTWAGGSGCTAIYGVAAPAKTPLMGQVREP